MRTLARARALARSLARREPQWTIEIMLVGGRRAVDAAAAAEPELAVRSVSALLDLDVEALLARHEEEALTVLLLPHVLTRLLAEAPQPVIHLPSSAWILAELEPLQGLLELHGVVLAPRTAQALPEDGLEPSAEQLDRAGRIDPTLIGVDGGVAAGGVPDLVGQAHAGGPRLPRRYERRLPPGGSSLGSRASWSWRPPVLEPGCSTRPSSI